MPEEKRGPYIVTSTRSVYRNRWISVDEDAVIRPDGQPGIFGVVTMVAGVTIVPVDDRFNTCLVYEYKYAIRATSLELVSGAVDEGEDLLRAAQRELAEEVGLRGAKWTYLGCINPFTTIINAPNHLFIVEGVVRGEAQPEDGEILAPITVPFKEALRMVLAGEITHAASCMAILKAAHVLNA